MSHISPRFNIATVFTVCAVIATTWLSPLSAQTMVTSGQFNVDPSGAATYTLPIQVPPGIAGMEPRVALSYSSQAGNGIAGLGWAISGLSSISRCPQTLVQDGVRGTIKYDSNDRLCLDGQRLILVNPSITVSYGSPGSEYRTEIESFSRIVYNGTAFTVQTKAGLSMEYGNTAVSRVEPQGKTVVATWALNKMTDIVGNYLTIDYIKDNTNGDFKINRIDYTGTANNAPLNSIRFEYESRLDIPTRYYLDSVSKTMQRLSKIKTYIGASNLVKEYRFSYGAQAAQADVSQLANITECDTAGVCLLPIAFTWTPSNNAAGSTSTSWALAADQTGLCSNGYSSPTYGVCNDTDNHPYIYYPDINGDGIADICYRSDTGINCVLRYGENGGIQLGTVITTDLCVLNSTLYGKCNSVDNWKYISFLDVNGDGLDDLIYRGDEGITVRFSNGAGFVQGWNTNICANASPNDGVCDGDDNYDYIKYADINGDGLVDLCLRANSGIRCIINKGGALGWDRSEIIITSICANASTLFGICNSIYNWKYINFIDINADGKADLVYRANTGIRTWLSTGTSFTPHWTTTICADNSTLDGGCNSDDNFAYIQYPDINNDGLPDVCFRADQGIRCIINKGGALGWDRSTVFTTNLCANSSTLYGYCNDSSNWSTINYVDVNGDGFPDILYRSDSGIRAALNTGTGFRMDALTTDFCKDTSPAFVCDVTTLRVLPGYHGYGNVTLMLRGTTAGIVILRGFMSMYNLNIYPPTGFQRLLYKIEEGNTKTYIDYANIAGAPYISIPISKTSQGWTETVSQPVYTKDSAGLAAQSAMLDIQPPLAVVKSVGKSKGVSIAQSGINIPGQFPPVNDLNFVSYTYGGLKTQPGLAGRGFQGFRWMRSYEISTGISTYTEYSQAWPFTGSPLLSKTYIINTTATPSLLKQSINNMACKVPMTAAACAPIPSNCSLAANLTQCVAASQNRMFLYSASSTEQSWDLNGTAMPSSSTTYSYDLNAGDTQLWGDPTQITVTNSGGASKTTVNEYYPATTTGGKWILGRLKKATVTSTQP